MNRRDRGRRQRMRYVLFHVTIEFNLVFNVKAYHSYYIL